VTELRAALETLLGGCAPGQRLPAERTLAIELRVGRTLVRRLLRDLEHEGRIEIRAQSGSYRMEARR
jgi:DNA-binding FadR family transcriptional regulator